MHSLSGGTGSGCGSKLIEMLRDEYGAKKYLFTQSVAPFSNGELPLQHYNNLLCLSHLHEFVDSIFLFQNDDVFEILDRCQRDAIGSKPAPTTKFSKSKSTEQMSGTISLTEMNQYMIKALLGTILPVDNVSLKEQSIGMEYSELQRLLCYNPNTKIIELYNVNGTETLQAPNTRGNISSQAQNALKTNPLLKSFVSNVPKYDKDLSKQYVNQ